jgi:pimeloyl-ACP methyl ester carboxylesterase
METLTHRAIPNEPLTSSRPAYLERVADSPTLTIFLHGLGLDADDYRDFLVNHNRHAIALTMLGFDPDSSHSGRLQPIEQTTHIQVIAEFIDRIAKRYPQKRLILVGFSLGADMVLQLAERWQERLEGPPNLSAALLLDPNVNRSTMTISSLFADADPKNPAPAFKQLFDLASDLEAVRIFATYISKVADKDFAQVYQH